MYPTNSHVSSVSHATNVSSSVTHELTLLNLLAPSTYERTSREVRVHTYIHTYMCICGPHYRDGGVGTCTIYVCVCVCVCVCLCVCVCVCVYVWAPFMENGETGGDFLQSPLCSDFMQEVY
jgi:hypothetical protein